MSGKTKVLLATAIAGILGGGLAHAEGAKKSTMMKKAEGSVNCYGVNKCAGHGKCGGEGHACAGQNTCKGQGWLPMPKDSCLGIEGGSLEPIKKS
jgi:uncharacterized membrane protein